MFRIVPTFGVAARRSKENGDWPPMMSNGDSGNGFQPDPEKGSKSRREPRNGVGLNPIGTYNTHVDTYSFPRVAGGREDAS